MKKIVYVVFAKSIEGPHWMPVSLRSSWVNAEKDCLRLINAMCPDGIYYHQGGAAFFKGRKENNIGGSQADVYYEAQEMEDVRFVDYLVERWQEKNNA